MSISPSSFPPIFRVSNIFPKAISPKNVKPKISPKCISPKISENRFPLKQKFPKKKKTIDVHVHVHMYVYVITTKQ